MAIAATFPQNFKAFKSYYERPVKALDYDVLFNQVRSTREKLLAVWSSMSQETRDRIYNDALSAVMHLKGPKEISIFDYAKTLVVSSKLIISGQFYPFMAFANEAYHLFDEVLSYAEHSNPAWRADVETALCEISLEEAQELPGDLSDLLSFFSKL